MSSAKADHLRSASGFTLIELLVVILIIGILAAMAIPSFLNQRNKGRDACAKVQLRNALTAAQVYRLERSGSSVGMTLPLLNAIESRVPAVTNGGCPGVTNFGVFNLPAANAACTGTVGAPGVSTFCIRIYSGTTVRYNISHAANGTVSRTCYVPAGVNRGGCPSSNRW